MLGHYHLTLLVTGQVPGHLLCEHGGYQEMFAKRFDHLANISWEVVDLREEDAPVKADRRRGYVVTGSASGTYDDEPWILRAHDQIRYLVQQDCALLGVCFGHQLLASALGGSSGPHDSGFCTGLLGAMDQRHHLYFHQDQVSQPPPGFMVSHRADHCPIAGIESADGRVIGVQFHPEFTPQFVQDLANHRGLTLSRQVGEPDRKAEDKLLRDWLRKI